MSGVEAPNFAAQKSAAANELNEINNMLSDASNYTPTGTSSLFSPARPGFGEGEKGCLQEVWWR